MEANTHVWHTVLHGAYDGSGFGRGLGGGKTGISDTDYGPGKRVVDTSQPFRTEARFHTDSAGRFASLEVTLKQNSRALSFSVSHPSYIAPMTQALEAGMTLVASYWSSEWMGWLSGGICATENQHACGDRVTYSEFTLCEGAGTAPCNFHAP